jgi:hypothetical protein
MHPNDAIPHRDEGRAAEWQAARRMLANAAPPDSVEANLMQAFARRHQRQPWYRRLSLDLLATWAGIGVAGCALAITVAGMQVPARHPPAMPVAGADGFLALAPADRIEAAVNPRLKRADLPRQALLQMGIPIAADAPDELIHAELLVAATGEPLAVRLALN